MRTWKFSLALLLSLFVSATSFGQDETKENGEADLEQAIELKITAGSDRELDEVADLCESAIQKGLSAESEKYAKELWSSTLYDHAKQYAEKILKGEYGEKWPPYRRRALIRLEEAVVIDPTFGEAHLLIARLNLELPRGDEEVAKKSLEKYIESSGDDKGKISDAYVLQARVAKDDKEILDLLNKALEANDKNLDALKLRGSQYLTLSARDESDSGYKEKALDDFKRMAELEPDDRLGIAIVAQTLVDMEKYDEALGYADKLIDLDPEVTDGYLMRSRIFAAQEKIIEAIEEAGRAIEKDSDDFSAYLLRAGMYYDQKDYGNALEDIEATLDLAPRNIRALYMRGFINLAKEDYEPALADMRLLVENAQYTYQQNPDNEAALDAWLSYASDYAMFHVAAKKSKIGIRIYDQVLEEEPENTRALRGRGDAYLNIGDHENAIADYKAAHKIDPEDDGILNNYAWVLSTSPDDHVRDGKLAVELALKACEVTEYKEAHILSTLAACYAETGDFEKAKEWAAKAVELARDEEQRTGLQEELDLYSKDQPEPWRERESEGDEDKTEKAEESADEIGDDEKPNEKDDSKKKKKQSDKKEGDGIHQLK